MAPKLVNDALTLLKPQNADLSYRTRLKSRSSTCAPQVVRSVLRLHSHPKSVPSAWCGTCSSSPCTSLLSARYSHRRRSVKTLPRPHLHGKDCALPFNLRSKIGKPPSLSSLLPLHLLSALLRVSSFPHPTCGCPFIVLRAPA